MAENGRGAFVLFEGVDKSGKTTQCRGLVDHLNSDKVRPQLPGPVELLRFPDREDAATGQLISRYLKKEIELDAIAVHLLFAANRHAVRDKLVAKLRQGITLVVDRYAFSGAAFTAAQELRTPLGEPCFGLDWCKEADRGLIAPDLTLFLDMGPEDAAAAARGGWGEERFEKTDLQRRVRELYLELLPSSQASTGTCRIIDATQSVDQVAAEVQQAALATIRACKAGEQPLRTMWQPAPSLSANPAAAGGPSPAKLGLQQQESSSPASKLQHEALAPAKRVKLSGP